MNILDENIIESQRRLMVKWRVPFRQIGYEVGRKGMKDERIIPFLLTLPRPTFFTTDTDFYNREFRHSRYCLVILDVVDSEAAKFIRRVLRHPEFNTHAKRMGVVVRASQSGLTAWWRNVENEKRFSWAD